MMDWIFILISTTLFFLIVILNLYSTSIVFSQDNSNININKTNSWISIKDNLNATMFLEPEIPIIDEKTKISFEIQKLDNSDAFESLNAKVTMTDHDGRLYKFENKFIPIINGKFSVDYIFPDDGEHRIILQLYKNTSAFAISSFSILVPHPLPPDNFLNQLFQYLFP